MRSKTARPAHAAAAEAGSISILALWSVAIIALLLLAAVATTRSELLITRNSLAESRARLAAEAGTQLGISRLLHRRAEGMMVFDGTPEFWHDGAVEVSVSLVDEAGKIDLNEAPLELLQGLLVAVGRTREEALLLACNILDWRGTGGAPCPEPADGGDRRPTSGHPFIVPEQLAQVPGFDDHLYGVMADYVTVATRASAIDPLVAARPDLLAIPGATPTLVDTFIESRSRWHDIEAADSGLGLMRALPFVTTSPAREFTINSIATTASHARYRMELLIRLTNIPANPYDTLAARVPPADRSR